MIIEIKGAQFVNKGAELMLHAIIQNLGSHSDDVELVLAPNANSSYKSRIAIGAYQKLLLRKKTFDLNILSYFLPKKIRFWLKDKWGIITEADIDVILDASGFSYGDQWPTRTIKNTSNEIQRLRKKGKKYIFLPQALGPFEKNEHKELVKSGFSKANLICAREKVSFDNVSESVINSDIVKLYPDFTNLVTGTYLDDYKRFSDKVLIIPNCNMISSRNSQADWKDYYIDFLKSSIEAVQSLGLTPVLLNHEGKEDGAICSQVARMFESAIEILEESDPLKVKGIIGSSKAIICSRFHGCVSALTQSIPCLGTSWSHKYEKLFEEYGRSRYLLNPNISKEKITELLALSISDVTEVTYQAKVVEYKLKSQEMWNDVHNVIDGK